MKAQADLIQYTIRGIPPEVDRLLRQKAEARHLSLNQVIVEELAGATIGRQRRADFSQLAGKWVDDRRLMKLLLRSDRLTRTSGSEGCARYQPAHRSFSR